MRYEANVYGKYENGFHTFSRFLFISFLFPTGEMRTSSAFYFQISKKKSLVRLFLILQLPQMRAGFTFFTIVPYFRLKVLPSLFIFFDCLKPKCAYYFEEARSQPSIEQILSTLKNCPPHHITSYSTTHVSLTAFIRQQNQNAYE